MKKYFAALLLLSLLSINCSDNSSPLEPVISDRPEPRISLKIWQTYYWPGDPFQEEGYYVNMLTDTLGQFQTGDSVWIVGNGRDTLYHVNFSIDFNSNVNFCIDGTQCFQGADSKIIYLNCGSVHSVY
jgi:hypothetical protein